MKRILFILSCFVTSISFASPGDTTWVQAHTDVQMDHYGAFDSSITFPTNAVSYRKIYMIFELGKYACPGNPQYCYDWDYTVTTYLMPPTGDTLELGRLITPYADHTLGARMPLNWKGQYVFDVTDYYPFLQNSAFIRVFYSGYSWGFTSTVKFAFIEGTPARDVVGIDQLWSQSYNYGHGTTPINTALGNVSLTAPIGTVYAEARYTITGHGGDAQACAEFCPNAYSLNLNNNPLVTQNFWRDDCGFNNYYPQNGTWIYNRAGWCPGDLIHPYKHTLTGITANSNYTLNCTFPAYTSTPSSSGSKASYSIDNVIIYYGSFNKNIDVSLEDIITPTQAEKHYRKNPFVGNPEIMVSNEGGNTVNSIKFEYGVAGNTLQQYTWTGTLHSLEEIMIELPEPPSLKSATGINNEFVVHILEANGAQDDDTTNNILTSYFDAVPVYDANLEIYFITNNTSENSWKIYDINDNVVAQRINTTPNTFYRDTIALSSSSYRLVMEDAGCDGMKWWANPGQGSGGYFGINKLGNPNNYFIEKYFDGDFGCGFTQYFTTNAPVAIENIQKNNLSSMQLFPNPAKESFIVKIFTPKNAAGMLRIMDAVGVVVLQIPIQDFNTSIDVSSLANGLYYVNYENNLQKEVLNEKLLIVR